MAISLGLVTVLLAFTFAGGQVNSKEINSDILVGVFQSSLFTLNLQQLNTTVRDVQIKLIKLPLNSQTIDLKRARTVLSTLVNKLIDLFNKHNFALTNLANDKTIPIKDLFGQYGRTQRKLNEYASQDYEVYTEKLKDIMGCPVASEIESNLLFMNQQINHMASIINQLKQFVFGPENANSNATMEISGRMAQIVSVLSSNVLNLKSSVSKFAATVDDAVVAIETANTFLSQFFTTGNNTLNSANTLRARLRTTLTSAKYRTLSKFQAAEQAIRVDVGGGILKLREFFTSKKFIPMITDLDDSYHSFYLYLRSHGRSIMGSIKSSFQQMSKNLDSTVSESSRIFFGAMQRTALKLTDIVLERGSAADFCFKDRYSLLPLYYQTFTTLIQNCLNRETTRWSTIADAVVVFGNLLRLNTNELSSNIVRCVTYTKFESSSADYLQAKECIKSSLEYLNVLDEVLEPQFERFETIVEPQIDAARYRFENCFASGLHEMMALLRNTRSVMDACAGRIEGCPRRNREDRDAERFERDGE